MTDTYLKKFHSSSGDGTSKFSTAHGERSAVIDMLIDPEATQGYQVPAKNEVSDELSMLLTAGSDTSSTAIISAIYYIRRHEQVLACLQKELVEAFPSLQETITYEKAKELPYLVSQKKKREKKRKKNPNTVEINKELRLTNVSSDCCHQRGVATFPPSARPTA